MAPMTQIKTLIAEDDVIVEKGEPTIVRIKEITLPENTFVGPLNIMHHALGCILDVVECGIPTRVEDEKCISRVLFLPVESGKIEKGDIIGAIKIFYVKTGFIGRVIDIGEPKVEISREKVTGNLVWKDNGNVYRKAVEVKDIIYGRTHVALWEPVVADEDVQLRAGDIVKVKVKDIDIPANTVVVPIGFAMNAYGSLVDVAKIGRPSRMEEDRRITNAIFLPVEDGEIREGDLLGVISVYYVGLKDYRHLLRGERKRFTMVYRDGGVVRRKSMEMDPFGFKRKPVARWDILVADEEMKVKAGKACRVSVKKLKIPRNSLIYPMYIMRNPYGVFVDTVLERLARVEEEKIVSEVVFLPLIDGKIGEGDLIGIVNVYDVEVSTLESLRSWLDELIEAQRLYPYE